MIDEVRPYARARMNALGYTEWDDGFNTENIPSSTLDRTYHVALDPLSGTSNSQDHQMISQPFTVKIFLQGARDPAAQIDVAAGLLSAIITEFLAPVNRLTQAGIKNITLDRSSIEPLAESDDNDLMVSITFTAMGIMSTR